MIRHLPDETATIELGRCLYPALAPGMIVFLHGDLGAGKTTLVRGYLRAAGYEGRVKSPTFTVVKEYGIGCCMLYHFDLYRLETPEELEWLGFRDYLTDDTICFIEWPERGAGMLPEPDLAISLAIQGFGRKAMMSASSERGQAALARLDIRQDVSTPGRDSKTGAAGCR